MKYFSQRTGARLGKGNGFNDLEWGILCELGVVDERTKVATTVHDVQVLDLPHFLCQPHDLPVDIICTPARTSEYLYQVSKILACIVSIEKSQYIACHNATPVIGQFKLCQSMILNTA